MSLTDKQLTDELECPICMEVMQDPVSRSCQHNLCRACQRVIEEQQIKCPTCRKISGVPTDHQLPRTTPTRRAAARRAKSETCPHHPETRAEYYCTTCDVITCDSALSSAATAATTSASSRLAATSRAELQRVQAARREQEQAVAAVHARIDATYNGCRRASTRRHAW